MKYSVVTFGCRVNQADSLGFEEDLLARGAVAVAPDQADLVLVNTCSVTASADQGARQTIRRIARDNPAARIVVTGCYATSPFCGQEGPPPCAMSAALAPITAPPLADTQALPAVPPTQPVQNFLGRIA